MQWTETLLDKSVLDMGLQIDGMRILRLDRKVRKGGGFVNYYAECYKLVDWIRFALFSDVVEDWQTPHVI